MPNGDFDLVLESESKELEKIDPSYSSSDSSPRHHKSVVSQQAENSDLPNNERSIFNRDLKASLVASKNNLSPPHQS